MFLLGGDMRVWYSSKDMERRWRKRANAGCPSSGDLDVVKCKAMLSRD